MSNAALRWAFSLPIKGPRKSVLLALAEHADDAGICWPSIARLVLFSGVQERAARNALRDLESMSVIATDRSQGRVTSRYILALNAAPDAGLEDATTRHDMPGLNAANPASGASQPGTRCTNPAPHAANPASGAPEPLRTLKEPSKRTPTKRDDAEAGIAIWNDVCGKILPVVQRINDQRRTAFNLRLRQDLGGNMANWRECCEAVAASQKLTGAMDSGWVATFDWVMKPANMTKILDGNYSNRRLAPKASPTAWIDDLAELGRDPYPPTFDLDLAANEH